MKTIDKSIGGTFEYDEAGTFVRHIPTTGPAVVAAVVEPTAKAKSDDEVKTPTPRGTRRHTTQE